MQKNTCISFLSIAVLVHVSCHAMGRNFDIRDLSRDSSAMVSKAFMESKGQEMKVEGVSPANVWRSVVVIGVTCYNIENLKAMCNELKNGKSDEGIPNFKDDLSNGASTMLVAVSLALLVNSVLGKDIVDQLKGNMCVAAGAHLLLKYGFKNRSIRLRETMATLLLGLFAAEKIGLLNKFSNEN